MRRIFNASLSREEDWYIAQCLEVDVASQGQSEEAASVIFGRRYNFMSRHL